MTDLFTPLSLRETTLPNRVMVSPMCQYSCEDRDGLATDWHRTHLGSRAVGGAGVVMTEATAVEARGRISPEDLGVWSDDHVEPLRGITDFVRSQGSVPAIQLAHAGRKASTSRPWEGHDPLTEADGGWEVVAPSDRPWPYDGEGPPVRAMDEADVEAVVDAFRAAAERSLDAGFEFPEVHAAHGYLLHEFLSPETNDRDDAYGGDFEDRTRLVREVCGAVREVWPDEKPVAIRFSGTDWLDDRPSWTLDETVRLSALLADEGLVDFVDISSGGIAPDSRPSDTGPGYQERLAHTVSRETPDDLAVGAVGGITTAQQADSLVRNGRADVAIVGREHLRQPYFALHAARELGATDRIDPPEQYRRAFWDPTAE